MKDRPNGDRTFQARNCLYPGYLVVVSCARFPHD